MIVIDIGCLDHGGEVSIRPLIARFRPALYFGFDPHPELVEGVTDVDGILCVFARQAAWLHSGTTSYTVAGTGSAVGSGDPVSCFDFASWLAALPRTELVVKLDCEGSEYALLERILTRRLDDRIALLLLEWHGPADSRRAAILSGLRCPVEPWG